MGQRRPQPTTLIMDPPVGAERGRAARLDAATETMPDGTSNDMAEPIRPHASTCPIHGLLNAKPTALGASRSAGVAMFVYGVLAYLMFFGTLLYAMGFVANFLVPKGIDDGAVGPIGAALTVNLALLTLFVVQHTIMARPAFKRWWTRLVPEPIERSTFVIAASASLILLFWLWRPMPELVWSVQGNAARVALHLGSALGWAIVLASSFMVSHADLFGLRQVTCRLLDRAPAPIGFRVRGLYRFVRHPLMVGFIIAFWSTPDMSAGHLLFAVMTTLYIFMGTAIEERDLIAHLGDDYRAYRSRVRGFIPLPKRPRSA